MGPQQLLVVACAAVLLRAGPAVSAAPAAAVPQVVYVSPTGSDITGSGASASSALASCAAAVQKVAAIVKAGLPTGGIEVQFAAGTYPLTNATACGSVSFSGTAAAPIVFRGTSPTEVIFDATSQLDTSALQPVSNATIKALLAVDVKVIPTPACIFH
jgi:hypothetical protein